MHKINKQKNQYRQMRYQNKRVLIFENSTICISSLHYQIVETLGHGTIHNELKLGQKCNLKCVFGWLHVYFKD